MRKILLVLVHMLGLWPVIGSFLGALHTGNFSILVLAPVLYYQALALSVVVILIGWFMYFKKNMRTYMLLPLLIIEILIYRLLPPIDLFD